MEADARRDRGSGIGDPGFVVGIGDRPIVGSAVHLRVLSAEYDWDMRTALAIAVTILATGCRAPAPQSNTTSASPGTAPPPTAGILPGVGTHHHAIATTSPDAQKFFDQGMALVFGFNHEEATRSFQRAAELDPRAPMPHWGIAWSLGPN